MKAYRVSWSDPAYPEIVSCTTNEAVTWAAAKKEIDESCADSISHWRAIRARNRSLKKSDVSGNDDE